MFSGAGHGPMLRDTGVRPSFKSKDLYGVELPSYGEGIGQKYKGNTQKRLGFIW
jgi:hypothetical protein